jgi:hypothetical protein
MTRPRVKPYHIVLIAIALIFCNLHRLYDGTDFRLDVWPFYDYQANNIKGYEGRKISKILHEYGIHISRLIGFFLTWRFSKHWVMFVVFWFFAFDTLGYILVFGQKWNPWTISSTILIFFVILFYNRWKKKKRAEYIGL